MCFVVINNAFDLERIPNVGVNFVQYSKSDSRDYENTLVNTAKIGDAQLMGTCTKILGLEPMVLPDLECVGTPPISEVI